MQHINVVPIVRLYWVTGHYMLTIFGFAMKYKIYQEFLPIRHLFIIMKNSMF